MSLRNKLKTNTRLETEGVTLQLDNTRVLLARAGGSNQKYNALMSKWLKDNRRAVELDAYSNDKFRNELAEFYADTIVLNWETEIERDGEKTWVEGIEGEEPNTVVPFNRANVVAYFNEVPDFLNECKVFAENLGNYRADLLKGIAGK